MKERPKKRFKVTDKKGNKLELELDKYGKTKIHSHPLFSPEGYTNEELRNMNFESMSRDDLKAVAWSIGYEQKDTRKKNKSYIKSLIQNKIDS